MQIADDGCRSRNDFVTRPIATEVVDGVFISNLAGAKEALAQWEGVQVLNLCMEPLGGADNGHSIEDSKTMSRVDAAVFVKAGADRLDKMRRESAVVVNCHAGINRSSAVVAYWLIRHRRMSAKAALALIKKKKAAEARRLRFKNRFQSFTKAASVDKFSWPTLVGGASPQFRAVLEV